jgi:PAS domain S-box-containing protein
MRRLFSTRTYAIIIVVTVLVPALVFAGFLAARSARLERAQVERNASSLAAEATAAIERNIVAIQNVLFTLAGSYWLQIGNFEGFYGQAANIARRLGAVIVLSDAQSGRQLVNTALSQGSSLTGGLNPPLSATDETLLQSGTPTVTGAFVEQLFKRRIVAVLVPIFRDGALRFYLFAEVPLERFADLLGTLDIRANQIVGVIDRNGTFVARSTQHDKYAGTQARVVPKETQSITNGINREGEAFHAFSRYSSLLGWSVSTAVPDGVLQAPMRMAIVATAGAGSLLLILGIGFAHVSGARMLRSNGQLGIDRQPTREEFQILFDSAPNGVLVVDDHGRVVLANALVEAKFGYSAEELIGKAVEVLVPERFRSAHVRLRQAFGLSPETRPMGHGRELYGLRKDGEEFPVEIGLNPIKSGDDRLVIITVIDISLRKRMRERLDATTAERDELRRRFINAQEQERLRLAHELHDQTGQVLAAALLEIKDIEGLFPESEQARFRLLRLHLEQVGQTLHHVAWELRPASIDELGLQSALADYIAGWNRQSGIDADFHCDDPAVSGLPAEVCTTVYRVVQEALTNVVKHAQGATNVSVIIDCAAGMLRVTIEDNGCGFDVEAYYSEAVQKAGLGLLGMRERLILIGAEFDIESSIGVGSTVFARIPLEQKRTAA